MLSIATTYLATRFNNIIDMLQLVFSFVNAPLLATFLLGMFWVRAKGRGWAIDEAGKAIQAVDAEMINEALRGHRALSP